MDDDVRAGQLLDRPVAAVAVDEEKTFEALAAQRIEKFAHQREVGVLPDARAARVSGEVRRDAVREHRQDRHTERLGRLDGDALRENGIGRERQVSVLLGRPERQDDAVVAPEVFLHLHPVEVGDPHCREFATIGI
jgi:hypothetical protein